MVCLMPNFLTRKAAIRRHKQLPFGVLLMMLVWIHPAQTGVFEFINDPEDVELISHPPGYRGQGGELVVTVGISPSSPHADEMEIPVQNALNTWNQLISTTGNVRIDNEIVPRFSFDFESVALHELGHCIGLGHPNLASESGLIGANKNYTSALRGTNNRFDLNRGIDGVIGSEDDLRGDDINLHWFNKANNNPFELAEVVDQTTYSVDLDDLPPGHQFAVNGDRLVSFLFGFGNTEAVMQQGIESGESRRMLAADDVATLRLAMSGLDRLEGTSDDYFMTLQYEGLTENADIVFNFDNRSTFAACRITGIFLNDRHVAIQDGQISFNTGFSWFFNPTVTPVVSQQLRASIQVNGQSDESVVLRSGDRLVLTVGLDPGAMEGDQADYWVRAMTPLGEYWLNSRLQFIRSDDPIRAFGGPIIEFSDLTIVDSIIAGLPAGSYTITFAVGDRNLIFDPLHQSSVMFTVQP